MVSSPPRRGEAKRSRHVPLRTCLGCRQVKPKREMVRIVRTLAGAVEMDPTGKQSGRGAYLCPVRSCWERGLVKKSLDWALQTSIRPENLALLQEFARSLPQDAEESRRLSREPGAQ